MARELFDPAARRPTCLHCGELIPLATLVGDESFWGTRLALPDVDSRGVQVVRDPRRTLTLADVGPHANGPEPQVEGKLSPMSTKRARS